MKKNPESNGQHGMQTYVVAGYKSWNKEVFEQSISTEPGNWHFIENKDDLTKEILEKIQPRYVFFLHWSWKVPEDIVENFECVNFHMTDLPYGRGGSPLQNLILRGHKDTKVTAFRMTSEMDAGPVYLKENLTLEGTAEEIYRRATDVSAAMIKRIITDNPEPVPQVGEITLFTRRKPEESQIHKLTSAEKLYNFIRMLDAEGYPHAYIEHDEWHLDFSDATLDKGHVNARVRITHLPHTSS